MPLIYSKVKLSFTWIEDFIAATSVNINADATGNADNTTFAVKDVLRYVPVLIYHQKII